MCTVLGGVQAVCLAHGHLVNNTCFDHLHLHLSNTWTGKLFSSDTAFIFALNGLLLNIRIVILWCCLQYRWLGFLP